jgi:prepilin-type N-terminal cleavage/methylation domain-containing protein
MTAYLRVRGAEPYTIGIGPGGSPVPAAGGPLPVNQKRGFTLIEILVVVLVIGILATIAIPRYSRMRDRAFIVAMKSDLRNLATSEESYYYDYGVYTTTPVASASFRASSSVTITMGEATGAGWSASAQHAQSAFQCFIYYGSVAPIGSATQDGQVSCS